MWNEPAIATASIGATATVIVAIIALFQTRLKAKSSTVIDLTESVTTMHKELRETADAYQELQEEYQLFRVKHYQDLADQRKLFKRDYLAYKKHAEAKEKELIEENRDLLRQIHILRTKLNGIS